MCVREGGGGGEQPQQSLTITRNAMALTRQLHLPVTLTAEKMAAWGCQVCKWQTHRKPIYGDRLFKKVPFF